MNILERKRKELQILQAEITELEAKYRKVRNLKRKTITVINRKASTVLQREDGLSIVVSKTKNAHGEVKVHWYNGKKGELINGYSRQYLDSWKDFLIEFK